MHWLLAAGVSLGFLTYALLIGPFHKLLTILKYIVLIGMLLAAVGRLQFNGLRYRLRHEYRVETVLDQLPFTCSVWLDGDPATFKAPSASMIVKDQWDRIVVLFGDQLMKSIARDRNPGHTLRDMG